MKHEEIGTNVRILISNVGVGRNNSVHFVIFVFCIFRLLVNIDTNVCCFLNDSELKDLRTTANLVRVRVRVSQLVRVGCRKFLRGNARVRCREFPGGKCPRK